MSKLYDNGHGNYLLIDNDENHIMIMGNDRIKLNYKYDITGLKEITDIYEIYKITHGGK